MSLLTVHFSPIPDVEAFAKAMEGADSKTEGSGDKKDDDEDMSLD